jgi:ATP-dependent exoDNAse (exonuclease V) alpha subunit
MHGGHTHPRLFAYALRPLRFPGRPRHRRAATAAWDRQAALALVDPDKAIPWIEQPTGLVLAPSQRSAVALALTAKVMVITSGPGVGKTTVVNAILRILGKEH